MQQREIGCVFGALFRLHHEIGFERVLCLARFVLIEHAERTGPGELRELERGYFIRRIVPVVL